MEPSTRLTEFLGCDIMAIIQAPEEAVAFRIVYEKEEAETRVGGRLACRGGKLDEGELDNVCQALLDDQTYQWELVFRHQDMPQHAIEISSAAGRCAVLLDKQGAKLRVSHEEKSVVRDCVADSPGFASLCDLAASAADRKDEAS